MKSTIEGESIVLLVEAAVVALSLLAATPPHTYHTGPAGS